MDARYSSLSPIADRGPLDSTWAHRQWYDPDAAGFNELTWVIEPPPAAPSEARDVVDPQAILQALPAAALIVAFDGRIVAANGLADLLFGVRLTDRSIDDLVPDGRRPLHALLRRAFSRTGETRSIGVHGALPARRADGSDFHVDLSLAAIQTAAGAAILVIVVDTTAGAAPVDELARQALTDSLTGLGNRAALLAALTRRFGRPASERPLIVLAIDLDGLREANRKHGHAAGDDLLRRYAARLTATVRTGDVVARTGGDEFAVLCSGSMAAGRAIAARLSGSAVERRSHPSTRVRLTASIGIAARRGHERSKTLLRRADAALLAAKAAGPHQVVEAD
ncbi:MAG TPA: diguanylate cyclase [Candidatus Limnocylindrales bacterium]|nr:diguanylate cyclase [Candidatus Limnocylindrales bacterium]